MEKICVDFMNVGFMLKRNARHYPNKLAVVVGDLRLTYKEFNDRVNQTANSLVQLGVNKGDKVAMLLSNSIEMLELFWATAKIGAVIVPLNPMVKGKDNVFIINDCSPNLIVVGENYWDEIESIKKEIKCTNTYVVVGDTKTPGVYKYTAEREMALTTEPITEIYEQDECNIMYSSGTTGLPKGIVHTHKTRIMYAFLWSVEYGVSFESKVLAAGSLVFNGSLAFMYPAICAGATYVLMPKYDTDTALQLIENEQITHTMFVPTQIISLLDSPNFDSEKLHSLRVLLTLGAPLPTTRKKEVCEKLPGRLYELYGLTEGFLTTLRPDDVLRKTGSVGPPMIFNEFKIIDEGGKEVALGDVGEIIGRGPTIMSEYYNNPEVTRSSLVDDNWIKTGDLGYCDDEGFIYLVDRKKDMIISGGVNIYPRDIEEVISSHSEVAECAVFGIPHQKWGETPVAQVILKLGASIPEEELLLWVNERVSARYQKLSQLSVVDEFPRNASGKILKRKMKEEFPLTN
ncbi:class I adenylate-forming enzyme family protein [Alkalihalobacterium chitinilyticum]|uniref:AMP-binding protein n=1 Tax=Alkalihalobacterium chitinilyticum TaxID=2980103 RepID=A0ABT5VHK1_9BACI|nr:AMP-binding protein [Alkalihalobacterium chitinilyticum]MDE5414919.1 AMP-binding protein [Alkalihalobacterium chitinilyticum]